MTIDEIERSAMHAARLNCPEPPADLLDAALYLALYQLYSTLYSGQLTREQARPIKIKLIMQYNRRKGKYDFDSKLRASAVQLWKNVESSSSTYANDRSLENADRLWAAVLNLPEGSRPKSAG